MVHFYSETTWADYYTWPLTMKISPIANKISQSILCHIHFKPLKNGRIGGILNVNNHCLLSPVSLSYIFTILWYQIFLTKGPL